MTIVEAVDLNCLVLGAFSAYTSSFGFILCACLGGHPFGQTPTWSPGPGSDEEPDGFHVLARCSGNEKFRKICTIQTTCINNLDLALAILFHG